MTDSFDFAKSINKLEEINEWFHNEEIDLDEGLKKLKEGKEIIQKCRSRLKEVENEFIKIKDDFEPIKEEDIPQKQKPPVDDIPF